MRRSGLIVEVAEAEPAVAQWRARMDPLAARGVPAHITVLFPFMPVAEIDGEVRSRLTALFAAVPVFDFALIDVDWFDQTVLWLAPNRDDRFRALTDLVVRQWPDYQPYEGQFDEAVPHLTVADRAAYNDMRTAARELTPALPIYAHALAVSLMTEQTDGTWKRAQSFPLSALRGCRPRAV